jgi:hypothetical protein
MAQLRVAKNAAVVRVCEVDLSECIGRLPHVVVHVAEGGTYSVCGRGTGLDFGKE